MSAASHRCHQLLKLGADKNSTAAIRCQVVGTLPLPAPGTRKENGEHEEADDNICTKVYSTLFASEHISPQDEHVDGDVFLRRDDIAEGSHEPTPAGYQKSLFPHP